MDLKNSNTWNLERLKALCQIDGPEHALFGVEPEEYAAFPNIDIRVAVKEGVFGIVHYSNFFFWNERMYVMTYQLKLANRDCPDIKRAVLRSMLERWPDFEPIPGQEYAGYVVEVQFAGVKTPFKYGDGTPVFTGDVVEAVDGRGHIRCCGGVWAAIGDEYSIMLDNHCLFLKDAENLNKVGTVYYDLEEHLPASDSIGAGWSIGQWGLPNDDKWRPKATPSYYGKDLQWQGYYEGIVAYDQYLKL